MIDDRSNIEPLIGFHLCLGSLGEVFCDFELLGCDATIDDFRNLLYQPFHENTCLAFCSWEPVGLLGSGEADGKYPDTRLPRFRGSETQPDVTTVASPDRPNGPAFGEQY
jgi:hypothetical protein